MIAVRTAPERTLRLRIPRAAGPGCKTTSTLRPPQQMQMGTQGRMLNKVVFIAGFVEKPEHEIWNATLRCAAGVPLWVLDTTWKVLARR